MRGVEALKRTGPWRNAKGPVAYVGLLIVSSIFAVIGWALNLFKMRNQNLERAAGRNFERFTEVDIEEWIRCPDNRPDVTDYMRANPGLSREHRNIVNTDA